MRLLFSSALAIAVLLGIPLAWYIAADAPLRAAAASGPRSTPDRAFTARREARTVRSFEALLIFSTLKAGAQQPRRAAE